MKQDFSWSRCSSCRPPSNIQAFERVYWMSLSQLHYAAVTCKIKHLQKCFSRRRPPVAKIFLCGLSNKKCLHVTTSKNVFANILQMFYFTCNHHRLPSTCVQRDLKHLQAKMFYSKTFVKHFRGGYM